MKFMNAFATCVLLIISNTLYAKDLTVLVDLSQSNPLLIDPRFNREAAVFTAQKIQQLKRGDRVVLKTFGSLQDSENFKTRIFNIERHNGGRIAKQVGKFVQTASQNLEAQGSTNLLAWFGRNPVNCDGGGTILVLTDAIEASEYIDPGCLLSGKKPLPKPNEFVQVKGCEVIFYGLGVGRMDREANTLRKAWKDYFDAAEAQFNPVLL